MILAWDASDPGIGADKHAYGSIDSMIYMYYLCKAGILPEVKRGQS